MSNRVTKVYAWVHIGGGVVAEMVPHLGFIPFFYSDLDTGAELRADFFRRRCQQAAKETGKEFLLIEFVESRVIEEAKP